MYLKIQKIQPYCVSVSYIRCISKVSSPTLCKVSAISLEDFGHVFSNVSYILSGVIFVVIAFVRSSRGAIQYTKKTSRKSSRKTFQTSCQKITIKKSRNFEEISCLHMSPYSFSNWTFGMIFVMFLSVLIRAPDTRSC